MDKSIEKYWDHPKFYTYHKFLAVILGIISTVLFTVVHGYYVFEKIRAGGYYLLCFYTFCLTMCAILAFTAGGQEKQKDLTERKAVLLSCWVWIRFWFGVFVAMSFWIMYESSGYVLDHKLVVKPSPELTTELEFLTGVEIEDGVFDNSLDQQTVDLGLSAGHIAHDVFIILTQSEYADRLENDIRKYKFEAVTIRNGSEELVPLILNWNSAKLVGVMPEKPYGLGYGSCYLAIAFQPLLSMPVEILGNGKHLKTFDTKSDTFTFEKNKLFINTENNGSAWTWFCANQFSNGNSPQIDELKPLRENMIWAMKSSDPYILGFLLPRIHKDILDYF